VALGCDELYIDELHAVAVLLAPEALVGEQSAACVRGGKLQGALALLAGLGTCQVLTNRDAL
jgi:hypothetical protein